MQALSLVPDVGRAKATDWGSGTGRLSFTLAERFDQVTCVDISTSMLAILTARAEAQGVSSLDLKLVDEFSGEADHDFGLSLITIQHFPNRQTVRLAIDTMVKSLKPDGQIVI